MKKTYVQPECLEIGKMLNLTQTGSVGSTYDGVYTEDDPEFNPFEGYGS